jgi:hypothetical protein
MEHPNAPIPIDVVVATDKRSDHIVRDALESTPSSHVALRAQSSLLVRIGESAPPDFLVDDVGDFSPA